jgi:xylulokinase
VCLLCRPKELSLIDSTDCLITAFTGDNPASLSTIHLEPGQVMLSLGASDTLFFPVLKPVPNTFSHILCHPNDSSSYMAMVVYKNGSLNREGIRDEFCKGSWENFNQCLKETPVGCDGKIGMFCSVPEISPRIPAGRYVFVKRDGTWSRSTTDPLEPVSYHPRALIESHFMAMYRHVCRIGSHPKEILATGRDHYFVSNTRHSFSRRTTYRRRVVKRCHDANHCRYIWRSSS